MRTHTAETQASMTPEKALQFLKEGNERFQANLKANRNLLEQVNETSSGQFPFAAILSCIDSRTSSVLIFDQGLGDIFSIRIAGNFTNEDILGSMEYACKVAGSKLIVVLGHTNCGAVNAACAGGADGHIGQLLEKIHPAVEITKNHSSLDPSSPEFADEVAKTNVQLTCERIRQDSPVLRELEEQGTIDIVGGMYNVSTGAVAFIPHNAVSI